MSKRSDRLDIPLSPAEKESVKRAAARERMPYTTFARSALLKAVDQSEREPRKEAA